MSAENIANDIRDIINLVAVFEQEYKLPKEVVEQLRSKLEKAAQDLVNL